MGFIKLISRRSRTDEQSSRRKNGNGKINGCQSIPGVKAAGEENTTIYNKKENVGEATASSAVIIHPPIKTKGSINDLQKKHI